MPRESQEIDSDSLAQVSKRDEARKAKDFTAADAIRKSLEEKGILLEDTPSGTKWRVARWKQK